MSVIARISSYFFAVIAIYTLGGLVYFVGPDALSAFSVFESRWISSQSNEAPGYIGSLVERLSAGLALGALPFCIFRKTRFLIWCLLFCVHVFLCLVEGRLLWAGAVVLVHLFVFDNEWMPPKRTGDGPGPIVFFDGVCGLCNRAVDFIIAEDSYAHFKFAAIQGSTAASLNSDTVTSGQTMAVLIDGELLYRSDAALEIAARLGGLWRMMSWLYIIPRPIRDALYELIQRNRYRWFGLRRPADCRRHRKPSDFYRRHRSFWSLQSVFVSVRCTPNDLR